MLQCMRNETELYSHVSPPVLSTMSIKQQQGICARKRHIYFFAPPDLQQCHLTGKRGTFSSTDYVSRGKSATFSQSCDSISHTHGSIGRKIVISCRQNPLPLKWSRGNSCQQELAVIRRMKNGSSHRLARASQNLTLQSPHLELRREENRVACIR
jgi:hypothetical protein